ncbi:C3a anaphylatoxin chemotactic receptor-like protein [Lates japonicus]|uniref:C3a anaphylatoxin chemotactic receptor-like protein n=1 Tax=Lates japonicus TaxID=270547 RepID=A0AAD3N0Q6_LATJO|nr:C3a anaphylatoxin chemotactic receptor-like protein [Lates japonicus]
MTNDSAWLVEARRHLPMVSVVLYSVIFIVGTLGNDSFPPEQTHSSPSRLLLLISSQRPSLNQLLSSRWSSRPLLLIPSQCPSRHQLISCPTFSITLVPSLQWGPILTVIFLWGPTFIVVTLLPSLLGCPTLAVTFQPASSRDQPSLLSSVGVPLSLLPPGSASYGDPPSRLASFP